MSECFDRLRLQLLAEPRIWLVTGVAGFIGSNLLEELLDLGQTVIGLDDFSTGFQRNLDAVLGTRVQNARLFQMIEGDIRDLRTCRNACQGVDYVLHHAALGSVPWSIDDPIRTNSVNLDGFVNMLVAAKDAGVKRFVYASSSAVYGDTTVSPQIESNTGRPLSPYAASKSANETYALAFQSSFGLQSIGLRYFNVFGPRQNPEGAYAAVIPRWLANLCRGDPCVIYGDGETTRDYCYVGNVQQANILAAAADASLSAQVYNIGCGEALSLNQLFATMRDLLAIDDQHFASVQPEHAPFRPGDIRVSCAAIDKARTMLGFAPSHSVSEGLAATINATVAQLPHNSSGDVAPYGDGVTRVLLGAEA